MKYKKGMGADLEFLWENSDELNMYRIIELVVVPKCQRLIMVFLSAFSIVLKCTNFCRC